VKALPNESFHKGPLMKISEQELSERDVRIASLETQVKQLLAALAEANGLLEMKRVSLQQSIDRESRLVGALAVLCNAGISTKAIIEDQAIFSGKKIYGHNPYWVKVADVQAILSA
jgi:hypothetical protein